MNFHVGIVGGGIGGLCLAQGLVRAGIRVSVYERDRTRVNRLQGYRIHINAAGSRALHACLPPRSFDSFVATCGKSNKGISFLTEHLDELLWAQMAADELADPLHSYKSVSRITLRQALLAGLDDVVAFDKTFVRYEQTGDERVRVLFEDGSRETVDVLVGADGTRSRVRAQLLPHAELRDTGVRGIAGKLPLDDRTRALLPKRLQDGPAAIMAPHGFGMFLALHEFREAGGIGGNDAASTLEPGLLFDNTQDYIMWGLLARKDKFAGEVESMSHDALQALAVRTVERWHPNLQTVVRDSDPSTVTRLTIRTSVPVEPWETGRVTLLGDAIHAMPPTGGIGANTALRDAELLCRNLITVHTGETAMRDALHDYEAQMLRYGFDAVAHSMRNLERQQATENRLSLIAARTALRIVNAVPPLKRRMFAES